MDTVVKQPDGDLHAKNVSVLAGEAGLELAPAYDLVSTLPYGDRRMALQFEGRDFINFGARNGVDASWLNTCRGSAKSASSPNASQISNARCASGSRSSPELR